MRAFATTLVAATVQSIAVRTKNTDITCLFWCQSVNEESPSDTGSPWLEGPRVRPGAVEISTESLILAQDERWRRA